MLKPFVPPIIGRESSEEDIKRDILKDKVLDTIGQSRHIYSSKLLVWNETTPLRKAKEREVYEYLDRNEEPPQELINWLQHYWKKHPEEYVMSFEEYEARYVKGEK